MFLKNTLQFFCPIHKSASHYRSVNSVFYAYRLIITTVTMVDTSFAISIIQLIVYLATIIFALIYSAIILLVCHFHRSYNMFIYGIRAYPQYVAIFILLSSLQYSILIFNVYLLKVPILFLFYAYIACPLQVPLALLGFSAHRFCLVAYHSKVFFQRKCCQPYAS